MSLPLEARGCPICGERDESRVFAESNVDEARLDRFAFASRKLPEYMHHRLLECPRCGLLYASPLPSADALRRGYEGADYDSSEEAHFAARTYARALPRICRRLPDRIGALDVGAGDGAFLEELLAAGFTRVAGVEPSRRAMAASRPDVRPLIRDGFFRPDDFAPESLRLVSCFQTIEHVRDPLGLCEGARHLLKPGGALFLVFHDRRSLSARLLGRRSPIFDLEHLQLFCARSIRALLARAGFSGIEVGRVVNRYPLRYWLRLAPLPARVKGPLLSGAGRSRLGRLSVSLPAGNLAAVAYRS